LVTERQPGRARMVGKQEVIRFLPVLNWCWER
jgi:hypothetical protein